MENISNISSETWKKLACLKFDGSNMSAHKYHCVASLFLLMTVCKHLGIEETSCWTFGRGMLLHSCLISDSSCSTVLDLLHQILNFMMLQMYSVGVMSGLQAGQSSTKALQLRCCQRCSIWTPTTLNWIKRAEKMDGWMDGFSWPQNSFLLWHNPF